MWRRCSIFSNQGNSPWAMVDTSSWSFCSARGKKDCRSPYQLHIWSWATDYAKTLKWCYSRELLFFVCPLLKLIPFLDFVHLVQEWQDLHLYTCESAWNIDSYNHFRRSSCVSIVWVALWESRVVAAILLGEKGILFHSAHPCQSTFTTIIPCEFPFSSTTGALV